MKVVLLYARPEGETDGVVSEASSDTYVNQPMRPSTFDETVEQMVFEKTSVYFGKQHLLRGECGAAHY